MPLAEGKHSSQRDKDKAIGIVQVAEAEVLSAKASVRKAELDLGFTQMTAHETEGVQEQALRGGAVGFLRERCQTGGGRQSKRKRRKAPW